MEVNENITYNTDIAGTKRICHGIPDIGAYEKWIKSISVCGNITSNTNWIADTVKLTCDVTVPAGIKLTISPGTIVMAHGNYKLAVNGSLYVNGLPQNPVLMTINDTTGFYKTTTQDGTWKGIDISTLDSVSIKYCTIQYASSAVNAFNSNQILITNSNLINNKGYAINQHTAKINLRNCYVYNNKINPSDLYNIYIYQGEGVWENCIFMNNKGYGHQYSDGLKLVNCLFANNNFMEFMESYMNVYNCTFANNNQLRIGYSSPKFYNSIIVNNTPNAVSVYGTLTYPEFYHCCLKTTMTPLGSGNLINIDPKFVSPTIGDGLTYDASTSNFSIYAISPLINKGTTSTGGYSLPAKDILGNPRINYGFIDIGAYEHQGSLPAFTVQPKGGSLCAGNNKTFIVAASDTVYYQWQKDGQDIPGATSPVYTINKVSDQHSGNYSCQIENSYGKVTSNAVLFLVKTPPSILIEPSSSWVSPRTAYAIDVLAGGSSPLSYQWKRNNTVLPDTTSRLNFDSLSASQEGTYVCIVSNICGTDSTRPVRLFLEPQLINHNPATLCSGNSFTLAIQLNDTAQYQWQKDGVPLPGETNKTFSIFSLTDKNNGNYTCRVKNSYGNYTSTPVLIQVQTAPSITTQPANCWVSQDSRATLRLTAKGSEPIQYIWYKNSDSIAGAHSSELQIDSFSTKDEGIYYSKVTNGCGTIKSKTVVAGLSPQICLVTVDSATGKNLIVWDKNTSLPVEKYNVYREGIAKGVYEKIGEVKSNQYTLFLDSLANPQKQAYWYKITAVDSSGTESDIEACVPHKTIHLLVTLGYQGGVQLDWDGYYGFPFSTYEIMRSEDGGKTFSKVDFIASSNQTWTDLSLNKTGNRYFVSVVRPSPCNATLLKAESGPYTQSLSNIVEFKGTALSEINALAAVAYPNPFTDILTIEFSLNKNSDVLIEIINTIGQKTAEFSYPHLPAGTQQIQLNAAAMNIPEGIAFIRIIGNKETSIIKIQRLK